MKKSNMFIILILWHLNDIDCRYSIYQCEAESAQVAVNEFLTYNQIPQFMRAKISVV